MRTLLSAALLLVLSCSAAQTAPLTSPPAGVNVLNGPAPQWEYGRYMMITLPSSTLYAFNTGTGGVNSLISAEDLADKLGVKRSRRSDVAVLLEIYDFLGAQGWELVTCQKDDTNAVLKTESCTFKRLKR